MRLEYLLLYVGKQGKKAITLYIICKLSPVWPFSQLAQASICLSLWFSGVTGKITTDHYTGTACAAVVPVPNCAPSALSMRGK